MSSTKAIFRGFAAATLIFKSVLGFQAKTSTFGFNMNCNIFWSLNIKIQLDAKMGDGLSQNPFVGEIFIPLSQNGINIH